MFAGRRVGRADQGQAFRVDVGYAPLDDGDAM